MVFSEVPRKAGFELSRTVVPKPQPDKTLEATNFRDP